MERIGVWNVDNGYYFRVWAPHAQKVSVLIQQGPYWENETSDTLLERALVHEKGYWSITVAETKPWQLYRYQLTLPNGTIVERLDPAARDVISSELTRRDPSSRNASVIPGDTLTEWHPFQTPRFEDFIIYELHVGTFAGREDHLNKPWSTFQDIESKLS